MALWDSSLSNIGMVPVQMEGARVAGAHAVFRLIRQVQSLKMPAAWMVEERNPR